MCAGTVLHCTQVRDWWFIPDGIFAMGPDYGFYNTLEVCVCVPWIYCCDAYRVVFESVSYWSLLCAMMDAVLCSLPCAVRRMRCVPCTVL